MVTEYFIKEREAKPLETSYMEACTLCSYYDSKLNFRNNVHKQIRLSMIQMALARIVTLLEFTAMITQTSWIQNIVISLTL